LKNLEALSEFTIELVTSPQASALQWVPPHQTDICGWLRPLWH
jgi:hypothetical protein